MALGKLFLEWVETSCPAFQARKAVEQAGDAGAPPGWFTRSLAVAQ